MIDLQIEGRVALITGGNHGIGAAIATALAGQRASIFLTYLRIAANDDPSIPHAYYENRLQTADHVLADIRAATGNAEAWEADLARPQMVPEIFNLAEAQFGPVEILVNNADWCEPDSFLGEGRGPTGQSHTAITSAGHDDHFAVNSRAAGLLIAEFARRHIDRSADWGRIVSITSAGRDGHTGNASYGASKAAMESYTFTAASELARYGVTANVVEPMGTDTGWINAELAEQIRRKSPFGHVGQPREVADAVLFFVSEQARFLTGQRLRLQ
ncbi:MAG: SDR family oxidoreductase [Dehalococcoidia bacterium]|nr:SDR family oxidoreductase [Dehalococcoidia bacterium]